jgi:hypothetical protein
MRLEQRENNSPSYGILRGHASFHRVIGDYLGLLMNGSVEALANVVLLIVTQLLWLGAEQVSYGY